MLAQDWIGGVCGRTPRCRLTGGAGRHLYLNGNPITSIDNVELPPGLT